MAGGARQVSRTDKPRGTRLRARRRDTTALAVGSAVSGVLAYLVFVLTTRALGPEAAAPVSVLWSYWSFASAALTFPLQHWIATTVAMHGEGAVRQVLSRLWIVVAAMSVALGSLAWLGRDPLFHRTGLAFPALVMLVTLGSALVGVARGGLTARHRFMAVAGNFAGENLVRCVAVAILFQAGVDSPVAFGLCLVGGPLIVLLQPAALSFGHRRTSEAAPSVFAFLTGSGTAQLLAQVVLTGGPVVLALAGGTPSEVTAMFAALALFRAPYVLALGLVSQLNGIMTRLVARGDLAALRRVRTLVVGATAVVATLTGVSGLLLGPATLRLIFGNALAFGSSEAAIVGVACIVAVGNLVGTVAVMTRNRSVALIRAWLVAVAGAGLGFAALSVLQPTERTASAFLVAEVLAFLLLLGEQSRGLSRSPRVDIGKSAE